MDARRLSAARLLTALLVLVAASAGAAPKNYVFTGKFTSNRGLLINFPLGGVKPCGGVGLSNLRIMSGPGLTGPHTVFSMTGMSMQPNPTPTMHDFSQFANGFFKDYGCAGSVPGRKLTTTGAGVGGAFVMPDHVLWNPPGGSAAHLPNATPVRQFFTSWAITGPRKLETLKTPPPGTGGSSSLFNGNWRKFQKGAYKVQPGRVQGAMFTYCWGNPACANVAQGTKPLIVKYAGGGNAFGGTMAYVISSGPNPSNIAIAAGGAIGFALFAQGGSQQSGRGYAVKRTMTGSSGPVWGMYQSSSMGKITMVSFYLGMNMPKVFEINIGFPFTTKTVLARNTGPIAGNKRDTPLSAKGGDTVTAMGKRNISLVAGGMARTNLFGGTEATVSNVPEIAQLYVPEPGRASQLFAGVLSLLAIAASRRRVR